MNKEKEPKAVKLAALDVRRFVVHFRGISRLVCDAKPVDLHAQLEENLKLSKGERKRKIEKSKVEGTVSYGTYDEKFYKTKTGKLGFISDAFKEAVLTAGAIEGWEWTEAKRLKAAIQLVYPKDGGEVIPFTKHSKPWPKKGIAQNRNAGKAVPVTRPCFDEWELEVTFDVDCSITTKEQFLNICRRAGNGVGVGVQRPERGGSNGRWEIAGLKEVR